jgi:hypothetical protein
MNVSSSSAWRRSSNTPNGRLSPRIPFQLRTTRVWLPRLEAAIAAYETEAGQPCNVGALQAALAALANLSAAQHDRLLNKIFGEEGGPRIHRWGTAHWERVRERASRRERARLVTGLLRPIDDWLTGRLQVRGFVVSLVVP